MDSKKRRYADGCAAAHALDLIGERWALLVIRELLLGARRFTDLRRALHRISPNVLAHRLNDLEQAGVVVRRDLPPPAACRVYTLTPWGRDLEPVVLELLRWGVRSHTFERGQPLSADAMALSLKVMFKPAGLGTAPCRVTLLMGDDAYHVTADNTRLAIVRGEPPCGPADADAWAMASLYAEPVVVLHLAYGKRPLDDAVSAGDCSYTGDPIALKRFLSCFEVAPAVAAADTISRPVDMIAPFS